MIFSKQARPQDLQRAAAHELAEIRAMLSEQHLARKDALVDGSARMQLSAHDHGRLGELDVLLHQAHGKPDSKDVATELDGLLDHLGFDPRTLETNPRARRLLGDERLGKIVEAMAMREVPHRDQYQRGKEDTKEALDNEFEQGVADAEQATRDGRLPIRNADDLARLRSQQPEVGTPPSGLAPSEHKAWEKYVEYWSQRAAQLRHYFELRRQGKKVGTAPEPMITWTKYRELRARSERGQEFQHKVGADLGHAKVSEVLGDKKAGATTLEDRYVIRDEVGVASEQRLQYFKDHPGERETPQRPDHLAIDKAELEAYWKGERQEPPTGIAFSDKSYDFRAMKKLEQVRQTIDAHIAEAMTSYSGKLEIRSDKFRSSDKTKTLRDVSIQVDTVILVYDASLVGTYRPAIEERVARTSPKGKTVKVIFR